MMSHFDFIKYFNVQSNPLYEDTYGSHVVNLIRTYIFL